MDAIRSRVKHPYIVVACAVGIVLGLAALGGLLAHRGGEEAAVAAVVNGTSNGTRNGMEAGVEAGVNGTSNGTCNRPQSRISGGWPAAQCEAPQYLGSFGTSSQHVCHANVIRPRFVWVTAVCATAVEKNGLTLTIKRTKLDDDSQGETRKVVEFKVHPKWNPDDPDTWMYNQAVGKLDKDIEGIQYPCLAAAGSVIPAGTPGLVFGYGRTGTTEVLKPPRRLQVADVLVYDLEDCKRIYRGKVKDDMVCVGNEAGGQNICKGDDGAPLVVDGVLVAINFRGPKRCNAKNKPAVFQMLEESFLNDAFNQLNQAPQCGIRKLKTPDLRVHNGAVVQPHVWPGLVWLEGKDGRFFYGGALLDAYHVLTTWSWICPCDYAVIGGYNPHSTTESRQRIKVEKVTWIPGSLQNTRLALVTLSEPVEWTDNIRPICLPPPDFSLPAGTKCVLAGWGKYWDGIYPAPTQAELTIMTMKTCLEAAGYPDVRELVRDHRMICASSVNVISAKHDLGGALMCEKDGRWYAYGTMHETRHGIALIYRNPSYAQRINEEIPLKPPANQVCYKKFEG